MSRARGVRRRLSFNSSSSDGAPSANPSSFWSNMGSGPSPSFAAQEEDKMEMSEFSDFTSESEQLTLVVDVVAHTMTTLPAIKRVIDPEHENVFEELASFLDDRTYQLGSKCPASSPVKGKMLTKSGTEIVNPETNELVYYKLSILGEALENMWDNKALEQLSAHQGYHYPRLMTKAKNLQSRLAQMSAEEFKIFMVKDNGLAITDEELGLVRKYLTIFQFIVLLKLATDFPLVRPGLIYDELRKNADKDIFKLYHQMHGFLYQHSLTKTAAEPYLFQSEMAALSRGSSARW